MERPIAFDQSGKGAAVILVGGALTQRAAAQAGSLAALLAPHFTVIDYDRRGRGDSGDSAPYSVEREIEDLEALIDEAGGAAFVYGHSSGATLALATAGRTGAKIKKLALYEPPFMGIGNGLPTAADHLARLKELLAAGSQAEMLKYFMTQVAGMPSAGLGPVKNSPMWPGLLALAPTLVYDLTIMSDFSDPAKQFGGIRTPALALDGGASPEWAHNVAQMLVDILPNAKRRTLAGQTHAVAPEVLAPVLVEFFKA